MDRTFKAHTGFRLLDTSFPNIVCYLHRPEDPSSLGITRMLFGLTMLLDIPEERGGATMEKRWGDPRGCHFPLFPFLRAMPLPCMGLTYIVMWLGALGVMLGYKFRTSAAMFAIAYWYILLIEKSFWNNHSYLFGLIGLLLVGTQANSWFSLDSYLDPSIQDQPVPRWNYFVLKYQFFILYFVAGLKKGSAEWLAGYAMTNLSKHWVFDPFKLFLTTAQTDYLVVHWFAFLFDLTVTFWMMWGLTRTAAMLFCAAFHLMNTRLFRIGMFPWVCLATMPLFYSTNWPKLVSTAIKKQLRYIRSVCTRGILNDNDHKATSTDNSSKEYANHSNDAKVSSCVEDDNRNIENKTHQANCDDYSPSNEAAATKHTRKRQLVTCCIIIYMILQAVLPFSHSITKGYNNWTDGLYGYSWDMMLNSWDTILTVVKIVDNENSREYYLEPGAWTPNDRWSRHGDMLYQYARCIEGNILDKIDHQQYACSDKSCNDDTIQEWRRSVKSKTKNDMSKNISIYIDVWCSMNGRFQQRMFDPKVDLLKANWSPFERVSWLMPLLSDHTDWRKLLHEIRREIYSWNNYTNVLFVADFPGYHLRNYIAPELTNVTLAVLDGEVVFEPALLNSKYKSLDDGYSIRMTTGESVPVAPGHFHKVHIVGDGPACYMYTFMNETQNPEAQEEPTGTEKEKLPIWREFRARMKNMMTFFKLIGDTVLNLVHNVPMVRPNN